MTAGIVSAWSPERRRSVHQERRATPVWRTALPMRPHPHRLSTSICADPATSGRGSGNRTRLSAQERFKPINCALHQSPRSLHAVVHMPLPPISDNLPHVCRACTPL